MSLFDRGAPRRARPSAWNGLEPPPIFAREMLGELRWHAALYRQDGIPLRARLGFLGLRVLQRVAYNAGWFWGGRR